VALNGVIKLHLDDAMSRRVGKAQGENYPKGPDRVQAPPREHPAWASLCLGFYQKPRPIVGQAGCYLHPRENEMPRDPPRAPHRDAVRDEESARGNQQPSNKANPYHERVGASVAGVEAGVEADGCFGGTAIS